VPGTPKKLEQKRRAKTPHRQGSSETVRVSQRAAEHIRSVKTSAQMRANMGFEKKRPDPTPEEIREGCLEAQAKWSLGEEQKRMGLRPQAESTLAADYENRIIPLSAIFPRRRQFNAKAI